MRRDGRAGAWRAGHCLLSGAMAMPAVTMAAQVRPAQRAQVTPPRLIERAEPEFEGDTRDRSEQGVLSFYVLVGRTGTVRAVRLIHGLGDAMDARVMEAVRRYRFEPATRDGVGVAAWVRVEFYLNEGARGRRPGLLRR